MCADFPYRTALVTGATGHVGNTLVRELLARGVQVTALIHRTENEHPLAGLEVRRVRGDVLDEASLMEAVRGCELVFHTAGIVTIASKAFPQLFRVNVEGVGNMVRAAHLGGAKRLIHFSSIHAFSTYPLDKPIDETRSLCDEDRRPPPPYDLSKAKGERIALEALNVGVETVILNPVSILGPNDYLNGPMARLLLDLYYRRLPMLVSGSFDWVDVRDVVLAAVAAAELGRSGERYLLTGTRMTVRELADAAAAASGVPAPKWTIPIQLVYLGLPFIAMRSALTGSEPLFTGPSLHTLQRHRAILRAKAERELGYAPRPIAESLRDTYEWFRSQGKLS